ncbi:MAG: hypothetical protein ACTHK6_09260 [Solirubrobacterales bacterium]
MTAVSAGGLAALAAWLTSDLAVGWQIAVGIAGGGVGFLLPVVVIFAGAWAKAFPRQRNEARAALRGRSDVRNQAYAEALGVRSEVDRRTGFAQRWLDDELDLAGLKAAVVPMGNWQASQLLFSELLAPEDWRALVRVVDDFERDWDRLLTVAQRDSPEMKVTEQRALITDLRGASESLITKSREVDLALQPLIELSEESSQEDP